eukprot:GHVS01078939.1.p1 GENE.GHVS01078939.1~~GHVS01078939.1.p1  ORF type:complete len:204 (+),score=45.24 GHVS01078939.1:436-1047(+)
MTFSQLSLQTVAVSLTLRRQISRAVCGQWKSRWTDEWRWEITSNDGRRIDSSSTKLRMAETVFFPALINYGEVQWQVEQSDPAAMNPLIATATAAAVVVDAASPQRPGKTLVGYVYTDDPSAVSQGVEVTASMNGKIVKLDVAEGTRVSKGDALAVIEAMKMESVVRAPVDGTVASVRVRPGDAVSQRQLLMSLLLPDDTAAK